MKKESKVTSMPVENGSFVSYNIIQAPKELNCMISKRGFVPDLMKFVDALMSYVDSTNLVTIVTPEYEFTNMKITKFNYTRSADNGVDVIYAELSCVEIREVTSKFTNVRVASKRSRGVQQAKETSALKGILSYFKG